MVDVSWLRAEAAQRARSRLPTTFDGDISTVTSHGVPLRSYLPSSDCGQRTVFFLHGGYGLFGDLDFQDGYCRTLATTFRSQVVSIEYRLAPEFTFKDAIEDVRTVVADQQWSGSTLLCGDSAGGGLAVATSHMLRPEIEGLLLTNPNLDLSLESFDQTASGGPDYETSRFAFDSWTRGIPDGLDLRLDLLPPRSPMFVACGSEDSLLPEARSLTSASKDDNWGTELMEISGAGHGLISDPEKTVRVLDRALRFFHP
jgi:acetyl esterase